MSYVTNIVYHCDRCRKEIIPDTGTLNKNDYKGLQLITKHSINATGKIDDGDLPDLCDDCLDSLQEWYSSEKELSGNATMYMALI